MVNLDSIQGLPWGTKFIICNVWDLFDFIGLIPFVGLVFGTAADFISGFLAIALFGPVGMTAFWELADVTNVADSFIPTLTIIALISKFAMEEEDIQNVKLLAGRGK